MEKENLKLSGLNPPTTLNEALSTLKAYSNTYLEAAEKLHSADYWASDASYAGGALGIVGGLTKSPQTAIVGALLNGGGSASSQRYQYAVQATNYEKASDAMLCLRRVIVVSGAKNSESIDYLVLNERIDEIRGRLRQLQANVQLASPDLTKIQDAIKKLMTVPEPKDAKGNLRVTTAEEEREKVNAELAKCSATF
ncbi:hypothetical protein GCM10025793_16860 [Lysobacter lycopersici]